MPDNEPRLISDHTYDGIQEYDNPTPGWWHAIFLGTCVLSVFYFFCSVWSPLFVHQTERHASAELAKQVLEFAQIGDISNDPVTLVTLMDQAVPRAIARSKWLGNCSQCHGPDGGGGIAAPNLCDDHWKNVKDVTDIVGVIADGAAQGAMPAQGTKYSEKEIVLLAAYVASLRGTTPGSAKGPEGEPIPAWPEPEAVDAVEAAASAGEDS